MSAGRNHRPHNECVVEIFELVEVDDQQGDFEVHEPADAQKLIAQFDHLHAVGQVGKLVVMRHMGHFDCHRPRFTGHHERQ